jgi:hypothetical protein
MIAWGDLTSATTNAQAVMTLSQANSPTGFFTLPEHFDGVKASGTLTAEEGTAALVINLVSLWLRLPPGDANRDAILAFLRSARSPTASWVAKAATPPMLVEGSGEFGFGAGNPAEIVYNVVQNAQVSNALLAAGALEDRVGGDGAAARAAELRNASTSIRRSMFKYLVNETDGGWTWAIDTKTLTATPEITGSIFNVGFAGINYAMASIMDGLGGDWLPASSASTWPEGAAAGLKAFQRLANTPLRKSLFDAAGEHGVCQWEHARVRLFVRAFVILRRVCI